MKNEMFTCKICNEQVTKRQSLAYNDGGRICKTHPEADNVKNNLMEEIKRKKANEKTRKTIDNKKQFEPFEFRYLNSYCWGCKEDGVTQQYFYERMLVNSIRAENQGEHMNILDPSRCPVVNLTRKDLEGKKVLFQMPLDEDQKFRILWAIPDTASKHLAELSKNAMLCTECIELAKLEVRTQVPTINTEQLKNWMVVSSMVRPSIEEIVKKEDEERNVGENMAR